MARFLKVRAGSTVTVGFADGLSLVMATAASAFVTWNVLRPRTR
jgi:hypothetical protein